MSLRTAAKDADMAIQAKSTPATSHNRVADEDEDEDEEVKRLLKRLANLRQIREADNQVDHLRSNAAFSNHHRRHQEPHAHQEHPQIHRAGRKPQAETEEGEGSEEEKARQDRQAPPPQEEDAGVVKRRGEVHSPLDANKRV